MSYGVTNSHSTGLRVTDLYPLDIVSIKKQYGGPPAYPAGGYGGQVGGGGFAPREAAPPHGADPQYVEFMHLLPCATECPL
jgi:hypothetical protein